MEKLPTHKHKKHNKMKKYTIDYDITMSGCLEVEANTKEEAKQIALKKLSDEPYYFAKRATSHVSTDIIDVYQQ